MCYNPEQLVIELKSSHVNNCLSIHVHSMLDRGHEFVEASEVVPDVWTFEKWLESFAVDELDDLLILIRIVEITLEGKFCT